PASRYDASPPAHSRALIRLPVPPPATRVHRTGERDAAGAAQWHFGAGGGGARARIAGVGRPGSSPGAQAGRTVRWRTPARRRRARPGQQAGLRARRRTDRQPRREDRRDRVRPDARAEPRPSHQPGPGDPRPRPRSQARPRPRTARRQAPPPVEPSHARLSTVEPSHARLSTVEPSHARLSPHGSDYTHGATGPAPMVVPGALVE